MSDQFTVRIGDKDFGPVDVVTLEQWRTEGRLLDDMLVWRHGSPEWEPLAAVLGAQGSAPSPAAGPARDSMGPTAEMARAPAALGPRPGPSAAQVSAQRASAEQPAGSHHGAVAAHPTPVASGAAPAGAEGAAPRAPRPRPDTVAEPVRPQGPPSRVPFYVGIGAIVVVVAIVAVVAIGTLLRPWVDRWRAQGELQRYVLSERRFESKESGVAVDLPAGWVRLRDENPYLTDPTALARFAHPALGAFAMLHLDSGGRPLPSPEQVIERTRGTERLLHPDLVEAPLAQASVSGTTATSLPFSFGPKDGGANGWVVAWRDGWRVYSLTAWGPSSGGSSAGQALTSLRDSVKVSGEPTRQVASAVETLLAEAPELSRGCAELLVIDRLGNGRPVQGLSQTALREVTRGLSALSPAELRELTTLFEQVYAPIPEKERARLAAWLAATRSGLAQPEEEAELMRALLRNGIMSLPEEARARLQALNEKAVVAALSQP